MNFVNILLSWSMLIIFFMSITVLSTPEDSSFLNPNNNNNTEVDDKIPKSRFLFRQSGYYRKITASSCNKYPKICKLRGSQGKTCCKNKCVNLKTDRFNCGKCGKRCNYSQRCCNGKCVNTLFNKNHCGGCNVKCKKGNGCVFGMCNYA